MKDEDKVISDWQSSEKENELSNEEGDVEDIEATTVEYAQEALQHILEVCNESETDIVKSIPLIPIQSFTANLKHFMDSVMAKRKKKDAEELVRKKEKEEDARKK